MAYYAGGAVHFQYQDWLGTERMRGSYNGGVEGTFTSLPFGDAQATASGSDTDAYHFAGQDYDAETSTEHAQFRQYGTMQGRWFSPDPYSGSYDFLSPQSLNRYAYVMNSPSGSIDLNGLMNYPSRKLPGGGGLQPPVYLGSDLGMGVPGGSLFGSTWNEFDSNIGQTSSDGNNTYTATSDGWTDQNGVLLTSGAASEVGLPGIFDNSWVLDSGAGAAPVLVAKNNVPHNQKQNPCGTSCHSPVKPPGKDPISNCQKVAILTGMLGWGAGPWFEGAAAWAAYVIPNTASTAALVACWGK